MKLSSGLLVSAAVAESLLVEASPAEAAVKHRRIFELPHSKTKRIAWTVDDGFSNDAISRYLEFSHQHQIKFTHFVLSSVGNWKKHRTDIRYMIKHDLLQIGNHTRGHLDLRTLSSKKIHSQLMDCHHFIEDNFGVDARPFYRPPFGYYNNYVEQAAADVGYTTNTMWYGTLGDGGKVGKTGARRAAKKWLTNGRIVIGHTNQMVVPKLLPEFYKIVKSRGLNMVLLNEVFH